MGASMDLLDVFEQRLWNYNVFAMRPVYVQEGTLPIGSEYFLFAIAFSAVVFAFELHLDFRRHSLLKSTEVPKELTRAMTQMDEEHAAKVKEPEAPTADEPQSVTDPSASAVAGEEVIGPPYLEKLQAQFLKAQNYGFDKSCFGLVQSIYGHTEGTGMLLLGLGPWMYQFSTDLVQQQLEQDYSSALLCTVHHCLHHHGATMVDILHIRNRKKARFQQDHSRNLYEGHDQVPLAWGSVWASADCCSTGDHRVGRRLVPALCLGFHDICRTDNDVDLSHFYCTAFQRIQSSPRW